MSTTLSSPSDVQASVLRADDARMVASVARDIESLDKVLHDDFVFLHGAGRVDTKSSYIGEVASGGRAYTRLTRTAVLTMEGSRTVTMISDLEIERMRSSGVSVFLVRALSVWTKSESNEWQLVSIATVPMKVAD